MSRAVRAVGRGARVVGKGLAEDMVVGALGEVTGLGTSQHSLGSMMVKQARHKCGLDRHGHAIRRGPDSRRFARQPTARQKINQMNRREHLQTHRQVNQQRAFLKTGLPLLVEPGPERMLLGGSSGASDTSYVMES